MRKIGFLVTAGVIMLAAVALVDGQQPQPKKGAGGFGGGGFPQPAPGSASLTLLNKKEVKADLELTDDQLEKLPAEVLAAISKVLSDKQFTRFKQIELQQRGNNAFKDKTVQTALSIKEDQQKNISSILEDAAKERTEAFKGGAGGFGKGGGGNFEKLTKIDAEAKDKILMVLTKDQRKAWRAMVGDELKFAAPPAFGGFGKGKDTKKEPPKDK